MNDINCIASLKFVSRESLHPTVDNLEKFWSKQKGSKMLLSSGQILMQTIFALFILDVFCR